MWSGASACLLLYSGVPPRGSDGAGCEAGANRTFTRPRCFYSLVPEAGVEPALGVLPRELGQEAEQTGIAARYGRLKMSGFRASSSPACSRSATPSLGTGGDQDPSRRRRVVPGAALGNAADRAKEILGVGAPAHGRHRALRYRELQAVDPDGAHEVELGCRLLAVGRVQHEAVRRPALRERHDPLLRDDGADR